MQNQKIKKNTNTKAFTLIEALVAISILMIAIASPMMLAQKGLSTATMSKDQMIAAFLAQDAIEAVKNIRDQIAISQTSGDWLKGTLLNDCICDNNTGQCNFDQLMALKYCVIDTTSPSWQKNYSIKGAFDEVDSILKISKDIDENFLKYDYSGIEDSKFSRYINIRKTTMTEIDSQGNVKNPEAVVNVRVSWKSPIGIQNLDVSNFIYNYSENL